MGNLSSNGAVPGSFRDPSGFVFRKNGSLYRQINLIHKDHFDHLIESGLYGALVQSGDMVSHEEVPFEGNKPENAYKLIRPELVPFISYPYEWSFSQLKDAALLTLKVQQKALEFDMSLKDCSAYNVQFIRGKPVLIDTLSLERYQEGAPWVAYRQFCQHFLAPLALMSHRDIRLLELLRSNIDGIPLDLASRLLPWRTRLSLYLLPHVHLHARSQQHFATRIQKRTTPKLSRLGFTGILRSLEAGIRRLNWNPGGTEWSDYYDETNYSRESFEDKKRCVADYLDLVRPRNVWDLGANTGVFGKIAAEKGILTVAFDMDPSAVEKSYRDCRSRGEKNVLPLLNDLANPSPGIGWQNSERMSLIERGPAQAALALALIHHLVISNNTPFRMVANFLSEISHFLIIEFIPKHDSQVQRLLASREDIFPDYTQPAFEAAFGEYFVVESSRPIAGSERRLYLMRNRGASAAKTKLSG